MVSFFNISYIRLHFTHSLSFQFVAMVAHLLHFVKHVKIKRFSHMRRPIHLTVPLDKNVESRRGVVINWGCDSITRNKVGVKFFFHSLYVLQFCYILLILIYYVRRGVAQTVTRVGDTPFSL